MKKGWNHWYQVFAHLVSSALYKLNEFQKLLYKVLLGLNSDFPVQIQFNRNFPVQFQKTLWCNPTRGYFLYPFNFINFLECVWCYLKIFNGPIVMQSFWSFKIFCLLAKKIVAHKKKLLSLNKLRRKWKGRSEHYLAWSKYLKIVGRRMITKVGM